MEDEMERLRAMLENQARWGESAYTEPPRSAVPASASGAHFLSDVDDDEEILSFEHRIGGRLEHAIGHGEDEIREAFNFPQYSLQFAEIAPEGEVFCSLKALQKYPYNYISASNSERVMKRFFDKGLFFERPWDFFYIHAPYSPSTNIRQCILLIPSRQFQHFLESINRILEIDLKLPDHTTDSQLLFEFPEDGTPRPRYLGHTNEREMAECLKKAIPSSSYRPDGELEAQHVPTEKSLEVFKKKIDLLLESDRKKKALTKEKKKVERFARQRAWNREIKRVQRYLGLREATYDSHAAHGARDQYLEKTNSAAHFWRVNPLIVNCDLEWNNRNEKAPGESSEVKTIDVEQAAPYPPEDSVIFVCIDVEAFERNHNLITEIGIATLDTADIVSLSPGKGGINWMNEIHARHFRIKEYGSLENKEFINGCADYFQFGESEWISIKDAPLEISKCFKPPYSKEPENLLIEKSYALDSRAPDTKRNIILVGHDVMSDVNYLKKLGYDPYNLSNLQELIDTSSMFRALKREPHPRNLGSILATIDITGWYLHNAGNDAVYTLQAMIGISIKALLERPSEETRGKESEARIAESFHHALESARDAQQGWSSEGSDGGLPLTPNGRPQYKGGQQTRNLGMPWG